MKFLKQADTRSFPYPCPTADTLSLRAAEEHPASPPTAVLLWTSGDGFLELSRWQAGPGATHLDNIQGCCVFPAQHRAGTNYGGSSAQQASLLCSAWIGRGRQSWGILAELWRRKSLIPPLPRRSAHVSSSSGRCSHLCTTLRASCLLGLQGGPGSWIL